MKKTIAAIGKFISKVKITFFESITFAADLITII